jgi:multidrug efflux pump subunit AcrA (membrane-fusion protein)
LTQPDDNRDIRPRPDPTVLTTAQLDREIAHLKELMNKDRESQQEALEVALAQMDRRLEDLNELRKAVESDRSQFVRNDVYRPSFEEFRRQRAADGERMVGMQADIKTNATDLAELKSSMMWLSRLVVGALVSAIILYAFQRLTGR